MSTVEDEVVEPTPGPEDTRLVYQRDEAPDPKRKVNFIKWSLLHGKTEAELEAANFNPRTIDICAQELEKVGLRQRPPRPPKEEKPGTQVVPTGKPGGVQVFAKGSPPEAIIEGISLPVMADGEGPLFEKGIKFGASMIVLGVRVAQELSNLGVQQAKPIMEMARSMREGEAAAAKSAAGEAAITAAGLVQQNMMPYLASISKPPAGPKPMQEMIARLMEPMMQRMLGGLIPGAGPTTPSDWTKRTE